MSDHETKRQLVPDLVTNLVPSAERSALRNARSDFFRNVLQLVPTEPREDLKTICQAWLEATGAKWVWLWLKHEDADGGPWELTSVAAHGNAEDYIPTQHEFFSIEGKTNSVASYAANIERPVFVDDIKIWQREFQGKAHRVYAFDELNDRHCNSLLLVPLIFPNKPKPQSNENGPAFSNIRKISGLVCSHFVTTLSPSDLQDEESYKLMGQATATGILSSFAEHQRNILNEMDALATKYMTKDGNVANNRRNYLEDVIRLIRHRLQVNYVSVFYKSIFDDNVIECIASTGLYLKGRNQPQSEAEIQGVRYAKGQGQTGSVYESGVPFFSKVGMPFSRSDGSLYGTSSEFQNAFGSDKYQHSWACYPISIAKANSKNLSLRNPVGVLRCVGNKSVLKQEHERNFDPIQLQTIDFIASHMAPILETMAAHMKRERYYTIIKHDLYNPLRLLEAGIEDITNRVEDRLLPAHWEDKMRFSLTMARNLAGGLSSKESFHQTPISLVGDILTPLMSGLRYFAQIENNMSIRFDDNIRQFPRLNLDRELVERAFLNLIVNAIKYGDRGTEIKISGEQTSRDYRVHISNWGIGVDEVEQEKIFVGEYRSPRVKELKQGLGFGLKIGRAAMEKNEGELQLTRLNKPTTFTLIFPKKASIH